MSRRANAREISKSCRDGVQWEFSAPERRIGSSSGAFPTLVANPRGSIADHIAPGVDHGAVRRVAGTAVVGGLTGRAGDRADREGAEEPRGDGNAPSAAM